MVTGRTYLSPLTEQKRKGISVSQGAIIQNNSRRVFKQTKRESTRSICVVCTWKYSEMTLSIPYYYSSVVLLTARGFAACCSVSRLVFIPANWDRSGFHQTRRNRLLSTAKFVWLGPVQNSLNSDRKGLWKYCHGCASEGRLGTGFKRC